MVTRRRVELARARKAAGYTQEALAEALHVDRSSVIRWEAGRYAPVPYLWPKLAKLLAVSRERLQELFADEEVKPGNVLAPVPADRDRVTVMDPTRFLANPDSWAGDVNRRELLRLLGVASAEAAVPPLLAGLDSDEQDRVAHAVGAPSRVDELTIQHVESMLHAAMHQDDALGPQVVLDTVLTQRKLVRTFLADCPNRLKPRVLKLYSNMSRFAGWLSFDLTDYETSSRYYEAARLAAHEAEDADLSVFVLCNMSHLATWQGRSRLGLDHAMAAQNWSNETDDGLLRAYTADVAARAYAGMNNRQACLAALDTAQTGVTGASPQTPVSSLAYFYGPGQLAGTRSLCLLRLGDAVGAEQTARDSVRWTGSSFVRNRAFSTIHLGNAYLAKGELEQAAEAYGASAALAAQNRSARVVATIRQARERMRPWQHTSTVRELDAQLRSCRLVSSSTT